jgi:hypothetical protein
MPEPEGLTTLTLTVDELRLLGMALGTVGAMHQNGQLPAGPQREMAIDATAESLRRLYRRLESFGTDQTLALLDRVLARYTELIDQEDPR